MKHKVKTSEYFNDIYSSCTDDENEDGKNDISLNDQDNDGHSRVLLTKKLTMQRSKKFGLNTLRRSTNEAVEKMGNEKIRCWNMTQRKMKWRLAMRIATSPNQRWLSKAAERNLEVSSKYRTNRSIGRPRIRWEDEINEFLKQMEDETEKSDRKQQPNQ